MVVGASVVVVAWLVVVARTVVVVIGRPVVGVPVLRTMTWPVSLSTVVPGISSTMMTLPVARSTTRARVGSGRTTAPVAGWNDTGVAGWLGGISIASPASLVGGVTPPSPSGAAHLVGHARRTRASR